MDIDRSLRKIVSNLWFEWNSDVHLLFREVSPYIWGLFRRNLYRFLRIQAENPSLYYRRLAELLADSRFLDLFRKVEQSFQNYIKPSETHTSRHWPELNDKTVAYFSMEYGIDVLRIYSGGLGILSGDHLRGASDLGIPLVAVGLFYLHGYYDQYVVAETGQMKVIYDPVVPYGKSVRDFLPLELIRNEKSSDDLIVEVHMAERIVKARVWRARVGRVQLYLLDSNLAENHVHDRHITRRLYASQKQHEQERKRRLEQELLLGIGGVKALMAMGYQPTLYHLNEGHVAFAALEFLKYLMNKENLPFDEAKKRVSHRTGFTTHTPVPEGNECFEEGLVRYYLQPYLDTFLAPSERENLFNFARNRNDHFDMTKLSLLLSGFRNGVSALHGEVCRKMWGYAWGNSDPEGRDVPITSITNAVHVPYWQKPVLRELIQASGGLENISTIPDEKIWLLHREFKMKLIEKVRERFAYQLLRENSDAEKIHEESRQLLDPEAFLIGFARRFADYKRVTMILEDEAKLFDFLKAAYQKFKKPVHILFAGKPHPDNQAARDRIRYIFDLSKRLREKASQEGFKAQVLFIEGYDIDLARYLIAGVDIWLNNPIRPLEASGTSGMKAGMNGVLNVSIADGWVPEGIENGKNGWTFGEGRWEKTAEDRASLFALLLETVLPLYYERQSPSESYSRKWVGLMKESIRTLTSKFNVERMLIEYTEKMYLPAVRQTTKVQTTS